MASADSAGPRVSATFRVSTGPNAQVSGARGMPIPSTLVFANRLTPPGWNIAVEKKGFAPCASA